VTGPAPASPSEKEAASRTPKASDEAASPPSKPSDGDASPPASLSPTDLRALARRYAIRPKKSLGQHFLVDPAMARRIVELAAVGPGDRVVEVGAGLGSLTVALAASGAPVTAVEIDTKLIPALEDVTGGLPKVRIVRADAMTARWSSVLKGEGRWVLVANLPYNVATPVVLRFLREEPRVRRMLVMVQREAGERLAARPGDDQFGAVSLRVAYHAEASVARRVPATVFWPVPNVESALVRLERRERPPVDTDPRVLFAVIDEAFAQRRKTMRGALVRLGVEPRDAAAMLESCGLDPRMRPEELSLTAFAAVSDALLAAGTRVPPPARPARARGDRDGKPPRPPAGSGA
jgi:16S rRNA (adenine1518-N6/adenine1519-N6)-dimethyltransferase